MADLVIIVPSRGRPEAARELAAAFEATCTAGTKLVFSVDADDPRADDYPNPRVVTGNSSMVEALNAALNQYLLDGVAWPFAIGFMGDDHRPRTPGWDSAYLDALRQMGTGIVYGDDLLQRQNLPTQCAMTADIVQVLGYMAPPSLHHMYVDNFWKALGRYADCIQYLPNVTVEHLHPVAGKAQWDDGYARVNDAAVYARDENAFREYLKHDMAFAADTVRRLLRGEDDRRVDEHRDTEPAGRVRLRPAYTVEELRELYAIPHNHSSWADHRVRVAVTAQMAHLLAGPVESAADLSCGDGTILNALSVGTRYLGDFAPGYPITGQIDDTIEQIPVVDLFVCCETLEHLDDPDLTLKTIRGKTRSLVLSTPVDAFQDVNPEHYWAWSRQGVEDMLTAAGFEVAVYNELDFRPTGCEYSFGVWYCR